ncbi:gliding motility-associated C-terminal domain-containing protein [Chitinophaga sp. RCC_12]|uniref:T9SS type B sorting domain-containing protein n=1 Tax=Chitinophaga sp. RCC_12 TaxID=3239226 RepID=UPI003525E992
MKIKLLVFAASLLVFLNVKAQELTLTISHSDVSCFGGSDGTATANATGGFPPYTYSWSNGATTRTINNLVAGQYTCTITGLGGNAAQASVTVTAPPAISFTTSQTDVQCFGEATGSASVTAGGGTPPYTYRWLPTGGRSATASNLEAGAYRCVITDANGCDTIATVNVAQASPITFTTTQNNVLCNGQSNGTATVNVTGGGGPFTYSWSPVGGTAATANNLAAGTYTCTIVNRFGCDTTASVTITEPAAVLSATTSKTDVLCFGAATGSATVIVSGGTSPYTYSWSPGGGTDATANNLTAGNYTCTITDANGCTTTASVTISEPLSGISFTTSQTDVLCFGNTTGAATVNASGGTAPYSYNWLPTGGTGATASNLAAGTYTCTITDANGCNVTATVDISEPPQLSSSTTQTNVLCNGGNSGSATVTATGGAAPYTYSWSPSGGTGATANNLTAGTYTCTVTDANGCNATATVTITEPSALSFTTSQVNVLCFGAATGSATVNVSGGTAPYTYSWLPSGGTGATANNLAAGTYTCTITDANDCTITATVTITQKPQITFTTNQTNVFCNGGSAGSATVNVSGGTAPYTYSWSPAGGSASTANGLSAGTYTCAIRDANGCDTTATIIVTEPPVLTATATKTNISCNGANDGTATAVVSGGVAPYTYSWAPGGATTSTITNLGPGTYTCTATDANGCTITGTVSMTEPPLLTSTSTATRVSCNGGNDGSATAVASGGTPPYSYSWSDGATTATANNLTAGTYTCTITDGNGCTSTTSATVSQPSAVTGSTSPTNITCNGAANGSATVNASGGMAPYTYLWSNGGTTQTINNLAPGDYTVMITDANGCTFNVSSPATITEPPVLSAGVTHTDVGCNGERTGTATATATGGTAPYSYQWSPSGGTGSIATGLGAGDYTCNITDANGCTTSVTVTIGQSSTLNASFNADDVSCKGANDGAATATVSGGATPYTYSWSPGGETTPAISNLGPGTYTCTVTDANGCTIRQTVEVKEPALLKARDTIINNITCNGANDGAARVTPSGGTAPYTYSWSPGGGSTQTVSNLSPGTYTTTVTDANGCTATSSVTITEPLVLEGSISHTNITSTGAINGTATASATGGTPPYSYNWSPGGATSPTISGLAPGTYTCTITDANGCTTTESVTIIDPTGAALAVNTAQTNVTCNGTNTGVARVSAYGGTPPYTYSWSPGGSTNPVIDGLAPGTYTCTVTDDAGATVVATITITEPAPLTASAAGTDVLCNGGNSGSAIVTAAGGTLPYAYSWSNGATNDTVTNLTAGTYTVTITDGNGCTTTAPVTIAEPAALNAVTSQVNVHCNGFNDGEATVDVTGGTAPYSYSWSPGGGGGKTATGLAPGIYTCTITDANDCTTTASVTITEPDALGATANKTNVSCNGLNDGTATAIISGGTSPYTYSWDPGGETTPTVSNLGPGTYTAHVTDVNGCKIIGTVEITQPAVLTASITHTNATCNGDTDGSATVNAGGGTTPYRYSWSTGATTQTISDLAPGAYTCTVTDANNCTTDVNVTISEPAEVSAKISKIEVICNGGTNGSITLSGTGGTAPYTYLWQGGQTTAKIENLVAGSYTCTITDSHGCTGDVTVTITEPSAITGTATQTNVTCHGNIDGTATVVVTGGVAPYTYSWSPRGGTGAIATGLIAGTYTCTITDIKGCTNIVTVTITEPDVLVVDVDQVNVTCRGANDGTVTLTPSGGTAPYTYTWSTGATTATETNLSPGTHQFSVTDANNCRYTQSFEITEPAALTATSTHTNVSCNKGNDGTATAVPAGGTAPYTYLWSPGGATTATATGLIAGTYTCTVTDSNGCVTTTSTTVTQPPALSVSATQNNISCNGAADGTAGVTASGGTAPYTYLWSNSATTAAITSLSPGTYTCAVTDANGCDTSVSVTITQPGLLRFIAVHTDVLCNGSATGAARVTVTGGTTPYTYSWSPSGGTGAAANNLKAGTYTCTITDAHGCDTTATVTITEPTALRFTTTQTNIDCNGNNNGAATVAVSGGAAPYRYSWSPAGGTGATASNLAAGTYTCTIADANNCTTTATVTITQPDVLSATTSQVNVNCNGDNSGSATVTVTGGTGPYTYLWSNGGTTSTINNLTAGTYIVAIRDAHGCTAAATVTITENAAIAAEVTVNNVLCYDGNTGSISVAVTGGTAPYSYFWDNGATTPAVNNLTAGIYAVTITDVNGCDTSISVTVTEPDELSVTTSQVDVDCHGGNTGSATVAVSGGTSPYTYLWSNGGTAATANNLTAGTYTCTVTDDHGCDTTATVAITETAAITAVVTQNDVLCNGGNTGSISVSVTGGTAPYSYLWSNGGTTATINNLTAGTYTATITDVNGCDTSVSVTVTEPDALSFTTSQVDVDCYGDSTGSATVTASGGTSPYSYLWSNGETTATMSNLIAGIYTCTITDANGCDTTATVTIAETAAITAAVTQDNVLCNGGNTGSISITASGGTVPYSYLWSNGATTSAINNLTIGTYTCTITDVNGCTGRVSVTITEPDALSFTTSQVNVNCHGESTGSATVTADGGRRPYRYLWSNGGTAATINNIAAGTYTCTITDGHGCDTTATVTITETDAITATVTHDNVLCNGGNTGSISVAAAGGTAPYSYLWSNGGTTATINNLPAGTYTATITDVNGCDTSVSVTVTEPEALSFTTSQVNVNCHGDSTGSATVTADGGRRPYSYLWSNGATTAAIGNLTAGTYTCTITDAHGCDTTATITIVETAAIKAAVTQDNVLCNGGNTGSISVAASGGTAPYSYLWSNGATTAAINNLTIGTYTCTIADVNGCDTSISVTITEPDALSFTTSQVNVNCHGDSTGSVTVTADGGTSPYSYLWSNGGTAATVNNLTAGTYTCTITDGHGCDTTATVTITETTAVTATATHDNVLCNGGNTGSATVAASGGTAPYSYLWSNGGTTATINNLPAGTYTATITDVNGCDTSISVTVTEPDALSFTTSQVNVNCHGDSTGSATVTADGGRRPYSYLWSNGATTATISNLAAGTYTCTITDAHGCDTAATVTITETAAVTAAITQNNVLCNGGNTGSISIAANGGTAPYSYLWSNGATTAAISNLTIGTYTCTITDVNGCDTSVSVTVTEPGALSFITSQLNVDCHGGNNGSATVTVAGGTAPYNYLWSNGGTTATANNLAGGRYTCTITDGHGCDTTATVTITETTAVTATATHDNVLCNGGNTGSATVTASGGTAPYSYLWSNGGTTATINNLPADTYTATVTDANGCDTSISVTITEPDALSVTTSQLNVNCDGGNTGSATVTAAGGTAPYSYLWSNGGTAATANNLAPGTYTCTITDANGCSIKASVIILSGGFEAIKLVADAGGNGTAGENELLTYTIRVRNTGASVIENVTITDAVPAHTTFVSTAQGSMNNNVVSFSDINLGVNEARDYSFVVRANANLQGVTEISNVAEVKISTSSAAGCTKNPFIVIPVLRTGPSQVVDLNIIKQTNDKPVTVPDRYDYTIVIGNAASTASPVTVKDVLPPGIIYISSVASRGVADYDASNRTLTWRIDSLQNGGSESLTLRVQADAMGTIVNTATVSSPQVDIDETNNKAAVSKEVIPFKIPNVFTPNGNGHNDKFVIKGLELYTENELLVFNRWNANVYQKKNYQNDWDGSGLNEGTYFYILKLKDSNNVWHTYKGNVLILRR